MILRRLQQAQATYDTGKWEKDFDANNYMIDMIRKNSSKSCDSKSYFENRQVSEKSLLRPHLFSGRSIFLSELSKNYVGTAWVTDV